MIVVLFVTVAFYVGYQLGRLGAEQKWAERFREAERIKPGSTSGFY